MLVTHTLPGDTDLLALHRLSPQRYPLLLESSAVGSHLGRWDVLLAANGDALRLDADRITRFNGVPVAGDFLSALDAQWTSLARSHDVHSWPFRGGWALYLGYGLASQIEPILNLPLDDGPLPIAAALRCPAAVLRDHATGECVAVAEATSPALLDRIVADCRSAAMSSAITAWRAPHSWEEDDPALFLDGVERIRDYLAAGDVFQVNLSRQWRAVFDHALDPAALFARLREHNPAPFAALLALDEAAVVSASPERLVAVHDRLVQTRPIAGTQPRFAGDDDVERIRELVGHPKERAEHVMLVDLERNDLGRVCTPGSIEVDELMAVETHAHVHHIVSNIRGELRRDVTPGEVIRAVFPGGTITGCPKVRCMQIISELEATGRGAYTGALGWLNRDGDMDLNILIRSGEVHGDLLRFRTGAGIVADSVAARELEETRAKARGMLRALSVVE